MAKDPNQKPDVFTALLYCSVAATVGGIILLVLSMAQYGWALPK